MIYVFCVVVITKFHKRQESFGAGVRGDSRAEMKHLLHICILTQLQGVHLPATCATEQVHLINNPGSILLKYETQVAQCPLSVM